MSLKKFPVRLDSKTSCLRISVPENLDLALEGLIRKVLREQPPPEDIYRFAADYFDTLLRMRDESGFHKAKPQLSSSIKGKDQDCLDMLKLASSFPKPSVDKIDIFDSTKKKKILEKIPKKSTSKENLVKPEIKLQSRKATTEKTKRPKSKLVVSAKNRAVPDLIKKLPTEENSQSAEGTEVKIEGQAESAEDNEKEFLKSDPIKELVEKELVDISNEKGRERSTNEKNKIETESIKTTHEKEKAEKDENLLVINDDVPIKNSEILLASKLDERKNEKFGEKKESERIKLMEVNEILHEQNENELRTELRKKPQRIEKQLSEKTTSDEMTEVRQVEETKMIEKDFKNNGVKFLTEETERQQEEEEKERLQEEEGKEKQQEEEGKEKLQEEEEKERLQEEEGKEKQQEEEGKEKLQEEEGKERLQKEEGKERLQEKEEKERLQEEEEKEKQQEEEEKEKQQEEEGKEKQQEGEEKERLQEEEGKEKQQEEEGKEKLQEEEGKERLQKEEGKERLQEEEEKERLQEEEEKEKQQEEEEKEKQQEEEGKEKQQEGEEKERLQEEEEKEKQQEEEEKERLQEEEGNEKQQEGEEKERLEREDEKEKQQEEEGKEKQQEGEGKERLQGEEDKKKMKKENEGTENEKENESTVRLEGGEHKKNTQTASVETKIKKTKADVFNETLEVEQEKTEKEENDRIRVTEVDEIQQKQDQKEETDTEQIEEVTNEQQKEEMECNKVGETTKRKFFITEEEKKDEQYEKKDRKEKNLGEEVVTDSDELCTVVDIFSIESLHSQRREPENVPQCNSSEVKENSFEKIKEKNQTTKDKKIEETHEEGKTEDEPNVEELEIEKEKISLELTNKVQKDLVKKEKKKETQQTKNTTEEVNKVEVDVEKQKEKKYANNEEIGETRVENEKTTAEKQNYIYNSREEEGKDFETKTNKTENYINEKKSEEKIEQFAKEKMSQNTEVEMEKSDEVKKLEWENSLGLNGSKMKEVKKEEEVEKKEIDKLKKNKAGEIQNYVLEEISGRETEKVEQENAEKKNVDNKRTDDFLEAQKIEGADEEPTTSSDYNSTVEEDKIEDQKSKESETPTEKEEVNLEENKDMKILQKQNEIEEIKPSKQENEEMKEKEENFVNDGKTSWSTITRNENINENAENQKEENIPNKEVGKKKYTHEESEKENANEENKMAGNVEEGKNNNFENIIGEKTEAEYKSEEMTKKELEMGEKTVEIVPPTAETESGKSEQQGPETDEKEKQQEHSKNENFSVILEKEKPTSESDDVGVEKVTDSKGKTDAAESDNQPKEIKKNEIDSRNDDIPLFKLTVEGKGEDNEEETEEENVKEEIATDFSGDKKKDAVVKGDVENRERKAVSPTEQEIKTERESNEKIENTEEKDEKSKLVEQSQNEANDESTNSETKEETAVEQKMKEVEDKLTKAENSNANKEEDKHEAVSKIEENIKIEEAADFEIKSFENNFKEEAPEIADRLNLTVRTEEVEEGQRSLTGSSDSVERQIKTIETHYYDLLRVPETVTKEYRVHRTKEDELMNNVLSFVGGPLARGYQKAEEITTAEADDADDKTEEDELATPTSGYSLNLSDLSSLMSLETFLDSERRFSSQEKEKLKYISSPGIEDDIEGVIEKTVLSSGSDAVPDRSRESQEIEEEERCKSQNKQNERSPEYSNEKNNDSEAPFMLVEVETVVESEPLQSVEAEVKVEAGEGRHREYESDVEVEIQTTIFVSEGEKEELPEPEDEERKKNQSLVDLKTSVDGEREDESVTVLVAEDSSGRSDLATFNAPTESSFRSLVRGSSQNPLTTQYLGSMKKQPLFRTRSLSTLRTEASDSEVWSAIERELETAATKIQSEFRRYSARKKLRREDAVQVTTEESSCESEGVLHRSTGEFHDSIVLPVYPR